MILAQTGSMRNFALERLLTKSVTIRMDDMAPIEGRGKIRIIAGGSCTAVEERKHILHTLADGLNAHWPFMVVELGTRSKKEETCNVATSSSFFCWM
jgi:hypothetical protein